jgi:hypothetical protein
MLSVRVETKGIEQEGMEKCLVCCQGPNWVVEPLVIVVNNRAPIFKVSSWKLIAFLLLFILTLLEHFGLNPPPLVY